MTPARGDPTTLPTGALEEFVGAHAGCGGRDTDAWYPAVGTSGAAVTATYARAERAHARRLCAGCPVTAACLELALRIPAGLHGIWGATTQRDRRALLHRPRTAAARDELDLAGVG